MKNAVEEYNLIMGNKTPLFFYIDGFETVIVCLNNV
jgi:hypothetical protein